METTFVCEKYMNIFFQANRQMESLTVYSKDLIEQIRDARRKATGNTTPSGSSVFSDELIRKSLSECPPFPGYLTKHSSSHDKLCDTSGKEISLHSCSVILKRPSMYAGGKIIGPPHPQARKEAYFLLHRRSGRK